LLAHGRWFSPGTPASSTTKTSRHEIAEILLTVALNTKNQSIKSIFWNNPIETNFYFSNNPIETDFYILVTTLLKTISIF